MAVETADVAATVQSIDKENRTVTLKAPHGGLVALKADKSVKGFENLQKGDLIHARHTEAIALRGKTLMRFWGGPAAGQKNGRSDRKKSQ